MDDISEEIIVGCARKDKKCQKLIYEKYYRSMYAVCLRYVNNSDEAKDLLHDGFIKLFDKISSFKEFPKFEAWMRRLFTNHCIDHVRSAYKKYMVFNADETINQISEETEEDNENSIYKYKPEDLIKAFQQLRPDYRTIINLFAVEGYSHQEIAKELGIEHATSRSKLLRARQSLKLILSEQNKLG
ncbi:MAG: sigma-70 family RNA polymerase sigma factor [Bacteroidia bacterium]